MNYRHILSGCIGLLLLASCKPSSDVPAQFEQLEVEASLFPDYKNVVVPPNIAPMNFLVEDSAATAFVVELKGGGNTSVKAGAGEDGKVLIDSIAWRQLLQENKGAKVMVGIYAQHGDSWVKYREHFLEVAEDDIDSYLNYRLIEPGYELFRQLGLYQRNTTNWDVQPIYENNRVYDEKDNHCVNCHNFKNHGTKDMLFHVRANHGGTIIIRDGKPSKVQVKDSTILTAGVYPSWHPTEDLVAFSTNKTGQTFHVYHKEKIEVMDEASDLLLYDVAKNEVSHIFRTRDNMETFPCWSPDGKSLYYCNADISHVVDLSQVDSLVTLQLVQKYDSVCYDLMKLDFDPSTRRFGEPQMVVDAASQHKSITVPRVSPDGRYVLYTLGDYGQFHIWHKSSDLWVKDLQNDTCYALTEANSPDIESYHAWSSNGRWIAFSTRRDDGNYTRPYFAYFDRHGKAHKAFMLPQEDPEKNILLLKSYNVPEFTNEPIHINMDELVDCIYHTDGEKAKYVKRQ